MLDTIESIDYINYHYHHFDAFEQNDRPLKTNLVSYRLVPIYQLKREIELKSSPQIKEKEMPRSKKRKNNDLLSPLPTKMSRRETPVKTSVKLDQPSLEGAVSMRRYRYLKSSPG